MDKGDQIMNNLSDHVQEHLRIDTIIRARSPKSRTTARTLYCFSTEQMQRRKTCTGYDKAVVGDSMTEEWPIATYKGIVDELSSIFS